MIILGSHVINMKCPTKMLVSSMEYVASVNAAAGKNEDFYHGKLCQAFQYEADENYSKAVETFRTLTQQNNVEIAVEAQYQLGLMYLDGRGVEQDERKAFDYIKFAADNNDIRAQYLVGLMYKNGVGIIVNEAQSVYYLDQATAAGFDEALLSQTLIPTRLSNKESLYLVFEQKYKILQQNELDQRVVVPGVSGCAAIKCSVHSGGKIIQSIVLHSDGTTKSKKSAKEIGDEIKMLPGNDKFVSILMITNGANYAPCGEHYEVVGIIEQSLQEEKIVSKSEFQILKYGIRSITDIDLSGTHDEINLRYQHQYLPKFTEEQLHARELQLKEYQALIREVQKRKMHKEYILGAGFKGKMRKKNPYYVKCFEPFEWARCSPEERASKVSEARSMLRKYDSEHYFRSFINGNSFA